MEGLLVVRFPDNAAEANRNAFKEWLAATSNSQLDETGKITVVRGIKLSETIECLYRDAYQRCCKLAEGHDPISLVWASIRLAHQETFQKAMSRSISGREPNPYYLI